MKRSTANWTTAIAASALLAMPVGSWAQQATPTPSQTSRPAGAQADQKGSPNEHLRQAETALNDIPAASLTGTAKTKVAELKRHIASLNKSAGKSASAPAGKANWSTDVAAADRIITELLGAGTTTGATGTSGATAAKPADKTAAVTLDETAKSKLQEVRTHLTAFAASMSGASSAPAASTPSADDPSSSASASAAAAPAASAAATPSASPTAPAASPASASPSSPSASPSTAAPAATPSEPAASASAAPSPQAQAAPSAQAQSAQPTQSVDTENVKRHLTAARDTLSQLTQLPAAAQLTGDSRTQISQLISNFNELITTNTEWRASYGKLQANLNALVGEKSAAAPAAAPATEPGAVGTSGTTALDPAIRAKLEEFRAHLSEFEKAAGGAAPMASAASSSPAASATPAASAPDSSAAAASAASPSSPSTAAPATASPSEPAATPASPSTASPSAASSTSPAGSATPQSSAAQSTDAMRHIEAIEAILNGGSASSTAATGTSGSTAAKGKTSSSPNSLDREQIEKIREHLSDLRKSLNK